MSIIGSISMDYIPNSDISETSVKCKVYANDWVPTSTWPSTIPSPDYPTGDESSYTFLYELHTYEIVAYVWYVNSNRVSETNYSSTTITRTGLTNGLNLWTGNIAGLDFNVTVTVYELETVTTFKIPYTRSKKENGSWGEWTSGIPSSSSTKKARTAIGSSPTPAYLKIFTRPPKFSAWDLSEVGKGAVVKTYIKAEDLNLWVNTCYAAYRWMNQGNAGISLTYASSGERITATIYNNMANAVGVSSVHSGDTIKPDHFKNLQTYLNKIF